jgi:hypothetical protein
MTATMEDTETEKLVWSMLAEAKQLEAEADCEGAEKRYLDCLAVAREQLGERDKQTAHVYFCLSTFYTAQGRSESAKFYLVRMRKSMGW